MEQSTIHPKTGREMFKPQINQTFSVKNRPQKSSQVTLNLHHRHKFILEKKEKAREDELDKMNEIRKKGSKASKFSEQIVLQTRRTKINEIFEKLDDDRDGLISTESIDLSVFTPELHELFKPLLLELE